VPGFQVEQPELRGVEGYSVFLNHFDMRDNALHYRIQKGQPLPSDMHHQAAALCGNDILISDAIPAN
jgi:hypothetical protein